MRKAVCAAGGLILALAFVIPGGAGAFNVADIAIHGFLSQGYLKTSEYNFLGAETEDGTFEFTEAGINFNAEPFDRLRIGLQLYARDLGEQGNFDVDLDWAVADYRFQDWLGLRVGKIKEPVGLYNHIRDADMARPTVFLPTTIYPESLRDLTNTYSGIGVYGDVEIGRIGSLEYEIYGGTRDVDDSYVVERFIEQGAARAAANPPLPMSDTSYSVGKISADTEYVFGTALRWHTPVEGLLLSGTFTSGENEFRSTSTLSGWMQQGPPGTPPVPLSITSHTKTNYRQPHSCVGSIEYTWRNLRLNAEYWHQTNEVKNTISGLPFPIPDMPEIETSSETYYAQATYRFTDWLQLSGYYSVHYPDTDDRDGDKLELQGDPDHRAWLKDLALAARFDINKNWLVKLEGHFFDGTATLAPLENEDGFGDEDWTLFAVKTTVYF